MHLSQSLLRLRVEIKGLSAAWDVGVKELKATSTTLPLMLLVERFLIVEK